jgi:hypothetical protein
MALPYFQELRLEDSAKTRQQIISFDAASCKNSIPETASLIGFEARNDDPSLKASSPRKAAAVPHRIQVNLKYQHGSLLDRML